jgi:hypothetical protein
MSRIWLLVLGTVALLALPGTSSAQHGGMHGGGMMHGGSMMHGGGMMHGGSFHPGFDRRMFDHRFGRFDRDLNRRMFRFDRFDRDFDRRFDRDFDRRFFDPRFDRRFFLDPRFGGF